MFDKKIFAAGKNFLVYQKDSEINTVCIQVDEADFEVSRHRATIILPIEIWETVRQVSVVDLSLKDSTDEQLFERVSREIDERFEQRKEDTKAGKKKSFKLPKFFNIYGSLTDSREAQIERGMLHYQTERSRILNFIGKMKNYQIVTSEQ